MAKDAVALWQKLPNDPQASLHVMAASPLYARYTTSADMAPAPNIMYVKAYMHTYNTFN